MNRKPAEWMKPADDRLLGLLTVGGERLWLTPRVFYANLDISENWVYKRLAVLDAAGLIERDDALCRITDAGVAYLTGELDASELNYSLD